MLSNEILSFVELPVHASLSSNNENQLDLLLKKHNCSVIDIILQLIKENQMNLIVDFISKIQHYDNGIRLFFQSTSINEIFQYVANHPHNQKLIICLIDLLSSHETIQNLSIDILLNVLDLSLTWISNENMKISDGGSNIVNRIAILNEELCGKVVEELNKEMKKEEVSSDTTTQMRYLGIISHIHSFGDERYSTICVRLGATDAILRACEIQDILVQMIALEYIPHIMTTKIGIDYLITSLVSNSSTPMTHLEWLLQAASNEGDDYLRAQSLMCVSKLLSSLEKTNHSFCQKSETSSRYQQVIVPSFLSYVGNVLESLVESDRLTAILALTTFATSSPSAFKSTLSNPTLLSAWLTLLRSQPSVQGPTLHSIAQILLYPRVLLNDDELIRNQTSLTIPIQFSDKTKQYSSTFLALLSQSNEDNDTSINSIVDSLHPFKKNLFDMISSYVGRMSSMEYLLKSVKQPIVEVKKGATDILRSLAYQEKMWGLELLMSNIQFYNYLKDRTTEYSKEEKEWKFSLITAVYFASSSHLLSDEIKTVLREMILQGPYYMPPFLEDPMTEEKGSS